jgi:hypothetical protein
VVKARLRSLERILGVFREPFRGTFRVVEVWDSDLVPVPGPNEELLVLNIIRTPRAPARDPTNGDGAISEAELAAEVERLELERDALKARPSERGTRGHPRRAVTSAGIRGGPGEGR